MGRPLKVQKLQQDTNTTVDSGFPNDGQSDNGYSFSQPGVVGGYDSMLRCSVNLALSGAGTIETATDSDVVTGTGTSFTTSGIAAGMTLFANGVSVGVVATVDSATQITLEANASVAVDGAAYSFETGAKNGWVLRQKGKTKYMVAQSNTIVASALVAGQTYFITSAGDTNWTAVGAGEDAAYGKVFTAVASGSGTGTAIPVAVSYLVTNGTPAAGQFFVEVYNNGDTYYASTLTNHWVLDNESASTKYVATFFNDTGNVDPATGYTLVGIQNWD